MIENQDTNCKIKVNSNMKRETLRPCWIMKPVAAVPKTAASTPAVFNSPSKCTLTLKLMNILIETN